MKKITAIIAAAAALMIALSGCGSSTGTQNSGSAGTQAPIHTEKETQRIGCLTCIGLDEDGVKKWSQNVAADGDEGEPYSESDTLVFFDTLDSMVMALGSDNIDRISLGYAPAKYIVDRNDSFRLSDKGYITILGYSIAVLDADDRGLIEKVNKAIDEMKADGTRDLLEKKYITDLGSSDPEAVELPHNAEWETVRIAVTGDMPPMDLMLPDGTPAGFNTAFLAELSKRIGYNFELVSVNSASRASALTSGRVDALFWMRGAYDSDGNALPFPLDSIEGVKVSKPYLLDKRVSVTRK